jgi:hypothetical protein
VISSVLRGPTEADLQAAARRVEALRAARPGVPTETLVRDLVAATARQTALVGASTAGAALVPGLGTVAALTLGTAADVGATLRLQTRMVLDIALLRGARPTPAEARRAVLLAAGASRAGSAAVERVGRTLSARVGERFAARWLLRALPLIGMVSASGTNALATRVIGQRADAYFALGPAAVGDWSASVRALVGFDERPLLRRFGRLLVRRPRAAPDGGPAAEPEDGDDPAPRTAPVSAAP